MCSGLPEMANNREYQIYRMRIKEKPEHITNDMSRFFFGEIGFISRCRAGNIFPFLPGVLRENRAR